MKDWDDEVILERIGVLKRQAWDNRDFDAVKYHIAVERTLKELMAVAKAASTLYNNIQEDANWTALYEALDNAGLV